MRLFHRIAPLTGTALLLSGCAWMDQFGWSQDVDHRAVNTPYASGSGGFYRSGQAFSDPCQIPHPQAPVPHGCSPADISIGTVSGGFPQEPTFGPQTTSGGYGSHAGGNIYTASLAGSQGPALRKPRFRGSLELGAEKSVSGDLFDYSDLSVDYIDEYNPYTYVEGQSVGSPASGTVVNTTWFADSRLPSNPNTYDEVRQPNVSFSDAWSTPLSVGVGGEYILSDRATLFARAGYTYAEGESFDAAEVEATIYEQVTTETYDMTGLTGSSTSTDFVPEQVSTRYSYEFSDLERIDLEAGSRLYLDPIAGVRSGQTVTPFVGASAGASRINGASFRIDQQQLYYSSVYDGSETPQYYDLDVSGYDLDNNPATSATTMVQLYDSQWLKSGEINAGIEWQVTPGSALAFETGLRVEEGREFSNGNKSDTNITIPLTLRGSINF